MHFISVVSLASMCSVASYTRVHLIRTCCSGSHVHCAHCRTTSKSDPESLPRILRQQLLDVWRYVAGETRNDRESITASVIPSINVKYTQKVPLHIRNTKYIRILSTINIKTTFSIWEISNRFCTRTSFVPLEYHYRTTISKTSRKQRAFTYLWSTTIVPPLFTLTLLRTLTN